jgi:hypothetical protein
LQAVRTSLSFSPPIRSLHDDTPKKSIVQPMVYGPLGKKITIIFRPYLISTIQISFRHFNPLPATRLLILKTDSIMAVSHQYEGLLLGHTATRGSRLSSQNNASVGRPWSEIGFVFPVLSSCASVFEFCRRWHRATLLIRFVIATMALCYCEYALLSVSNVWCHPVKTQEPFRSCSA